MADKATVETPVVPEEKKVLTEAEMLAAEPKETVILTTTFYTNGIAYGGIEGEDQDGEALLYEVEVPKTIAADLRRRQKEYDRSMKERFTNRTFKVHDNGRMSIDK